MKVKKWPIAIYIVCIFLGLMLAVQFKTQVRIGQSLGVTREEDLAKVLGQVEKERQDLENEVVDLRKKLSQYEEGGAVSGKDSIIKQQLGKIEDFSGLSDIEGKGIVVVMKDSDRAIQPGDDPAAFLIHDIDLLKVVNELKASGAEAISVNNQRIVAMSEIRCAGNTILVNTVRLAPPYIIKATGDPVTLENALRMPGGIIETMQFYGIKVEIKQSNAVTLDAYKGSTELKYSKNRRDS